MAYVPGCDLDVFISYAHPDNEDGWVTLLQKRLSTRLTSLLTKRVQVWFDHRLAPGVYFKDDIQQRLQSTAVFVAVITPSYLESTYCMSHELDWFRAHGGREVMQLVKAPVEYSDLPLPDLKIVSLHDDEDQRELRGPRLEKALSTVVLRIKNILKERSDARDKIYVAQVKDEGVSNGWRDFKEALHNQGFGVLPRHVLIGGVPEHLIGDWLKDARASIHLGGVRDDSLATLQLEIAKRVGKPLFLFEFPPRSDEIPAAIDRIRMELDAPHTPAVYFVYDQVSDALRVSPLSEQLRMHSGCKVITPRAGEKSHNDSLRQSDGILLFRCDAPDEWLHAQELALTQCISVRRDPIVPVARYFAYRPNGKPPGVHSHEVRPGQWRIERTGEPDFSDLQPFIDALQARTSAVRRGAVP